jgi:hypothetical protein
VAALDTDNGSYELELRSVTNQLLLEMDRALSSYLGLRPGTILAHQCCLLKTQGDINLLQNLYTSPLYIPVFLFVSLPCDLIMLDIP